MFAASRDETMGRRRGTLVQRMVLATIVLGQVTVAPIVGFSLTYLLKIERVDDQLSFNVDLASLDWIIIAGLTYGFLSLMLALIAGGYRPTSVADRGGWFTVLGLRRKVNSAELTDRARLNLHRSPYGQMARLVSSRTEQFDLLSIHGGLQILAVPIQVVLIAVPLIIMEGIPERYVNPEKAFELGMAGYFIALWFCLRIQPVYSRQLIGIAAWFRKILAKISKFSWILPIIIFWFCARVLLELALNWLEVDYTVWHNVQLEAVLLKTIMPVEQIPDAAIIDFLVAISVLPVAVFTTISVLGGAHDMPQWMKDQEDMIEKLDQNLLDENTASEEDEEQDKEKPDPLADFPEWKRNHKDSDQTIEEDGDDEEESRKRMIDLPFDLFDD